MPCHGNISPVTGPLWGESAGQRWIPLTKAINTELWCFLWRVPEQTVEQIDGLVQDCSNSTVNALELLQPCIKPSKWSCRWFETLWNLCDVTVMLTNIIWRKCKCKPVVMQTKYKYSYTKYIYYEVMTRIVIYAGTILCMRPANDRRRYIVTSSPIGLAHTQNEPCLWYTSKNILWTCWLIISKRTLWPVRSGAPSLTSINFTLSMDR